MAKTVKKLVDLRISHALNLLCEEKHLTIGDLGKDSGIPRNTISRHYNGKTIPKRDDRKEYAQSLQMPFEEFETYWQRKASRNTAILAWFARLPPPVQADVIEGREVSEDALPMRIDAIVLPPSAREQAEAIANPGESITAVVLRLIAQETGNRRIGPILQRSAAKKKPPEPGR